jgi:hypothetical protein
MRKNKSLKVEVVKPKLKKVRPFKVTTIREVAKKLLVIFKKHIGEDNRLSRMDLFYEVYGVNEYEVGELKAWFMWDIVKKAAHYCRKYTRCKIISKAYKVSEYSIEGGIRYYFVVSNMVEAQIYCDTLKKCQNAMEKSKTRLKSAVRNGHHLDTSKWVID